MTENRILDLLNSFPSGLTQDDISTSLSDVAVQELAAKLNALLRKHRIQLFQMQNTILYKAVRSEQAAKLEGLGRDELIVHACIENAGASGIWTRDLKSKTSMQNSQITKILKTLEQKLIVKPFSTIQKRKVYLLYDLEPSKAISGRPWFQEGEPDKDFIMALQHFATMTFERSEVLTTAELQMKIKDSGISNIELAKEEVQLVVDTLLMDGVIELCPLYLLRELGRPIETTYRFSKPGRLKHDGYTDTPCCSCPVFSQCGEHSIVNPQSCVYMAQWLDQF